MKKILLTLCLLASPLLATPATPAKFCGWCGNDPIVIMTPPPAKA